MSIVGLVSVRALLLSMLVGAITVANAEDEPVPSGRVSIETTSVAAGIGLSWGNGKLRFNGREYGFSIDGVTFADFGVSKSSAVGGIYNLARLSEFEGNYVAAEANLAMGGGVGSVALRNANGVVIHLNSVSRGARIHLGSSGINIKLW
jgi:hypothetical protein